MNIFLYLLNSYSYLFFKEELDTYDVIEKVLRFKASLVSDTYEGVDKEQLLKRYDIDNKVVDRVSDEFTKEFFANVSKRIVLEHKDEIFINDCPVCGLLARTPKAHQCPAGHRW